MKVSPTPARIMLSLLALMLLGPLFALTYQSQQKLEELKESGADAIATISGLDCQNHGHVYYRFVLSDKTFGGDGYLLNCQEAKVGSSLPVIYSKRDPRNSEPSLDDRQHDLTGRYIMLLGLSCMIAVGIYVATRTNDAVASSGL
jgi:hypothetical protein